MERTYIVTPTVTGGPERRFKNKNKNILTSQKSAKKNDPHVVNWNYNTLWWMNTILFYSWAEWKGKLENVISNIKYRL